MDFLLTHAYLQGLNIKQEEITLEQTEEKLDVNLLPSYVPRNSPRYHLLYFPHDHNGDHFNSFGKEYM